MNKKEIFILEYASLATEEDYPNIILLSIIRIREAKISVQIKSLFESLVKDYGYLYRNGYTGRYITKYIRSTYYLPDEDSERIFLSFFERLLKLHDVKQHFGFVAAIKFLIDSVDSKKIDFKDKDILDEYFSITLDGFFDLRKLPTLFDYGKVFGVLEGSSDGYKCLFTRWL